MNHNQYESLRMELEHSYEGKEVGNFDVINGSYWTEQSIDGDAKNSLWIEYENGKEVSREVRPKRKPYWWQK